MKERSEKLEILDQPNTPTHRLKKSLNFMVFVNRYLGGSRAVIDYFESQKTPNEFTVADLGSGSGDVSKALIEWGRKRGKKISVTAFDINDYCISYANKNFKDPNIKYQNHSAFDFYSKGDFDYVISSMFFHHLKDDQIINLLQTISLKSKRGFLVNDLYRGYLPYLGVGLLSLFSFSYTVLHDATLSVARGFKKKDFMKYKNKLNIKKLDIYCKPMYRILMSYQKND